MFNIQAVLLAGGKGKRFWPLKKCKSLIPFAGRPIIRYIFNGLKSAGINDFKIIVNPDYLEEMKKEFKNEAKIVRFYLQQKPKGMADSLLSARKLPDKPMIVVSPEDLVNEELYKNFIKKCQSSKAEIILTGIYKKNYFPGGYFLLSGNKIQGIVEKPGKGKNPSQYIKLVLDYFRNPAIFFKYLRNTQSFKDDVYEKALDKMLKDGALAELVSYHNYWQSLKYPWHILEMMQLILSKLLIKRKIDPDTQIHKSAIIDGPVIIEKNVRIMENAVIKGPAYIGKNVLIGTNALVRESNIVGNDVIGFNSEICRSWVGKNCWFHSNYIGDSVLEEDISFGAGALTANFRLDQKEIIVKKENQKIETGRIKFGSVLAKGVRVGVNASLMPGILIGENSRVGPGCVLFHNLKEKQDAFLDKKTVNIR